MTTAKRVQPIAAVFFAAICTTVLHAQDCPECSPGMTRRPFLPIGDPEAMGAECEECYQNPMARCIEGFDAPSCRSEGIVFRSELFFANIDVGRGNDLTERLLEVNPDASAIAGRLGPRPSGSARFIGGWQTCEGLGFEARYWSFETDLGTQLTPIDPDAPDLAVHSWRWNVIDVEVTKHKLVNSVWDTSISGGYRFASYQESVLLKDGLAGGASVKGTYIGNGITGSFGVKRQIVGGLSVMGNGRSSLLLGSQTGEPTGIAGLTSFPFQNSFSARYVIEGQIGASYEYAMRSGGVLFVRGGYEAQHWNRFVIPLGTKTRFSDIALTGAFLSIGIER